MFALSSVLGTVALCTVTLQVAVLPFTVAVIVAVPGATAVTTPSLTVATSALSVAQATVSSVPSGATVAFNVIV